MSSTTPERLAVGLEGTGKKVFASALDWPGWSRSARTPESAIEALLAYAARYVPVTKLAGLSVGSTFDVEVDEQVEGGSGTEFGVPSAIHSADARPAKATDAERLASIVEAAWTTFDRVAAGAPAELRKGPRGGGRDRDKMVGHVVESDWYYARALGLHLKQPKPDDHPAIEAARREVLAVLRRPSDGSPIGSGKWPLRYAARRIGWHALDHAWEMEDRST